MLYAVHVACFDKVTWFTNAFLSEILANRHEDNEEDIFIKLCMKTSTQVNVLVNVMQEPDLCKLQQLRQLPALQDLQICLAPLPTVHCGSESGPRLSYLF